MEEGLSSHSNSNENNSTTPTSTFGSFKGWSSQDWLRYLNEFVSRHNRELDSAKSLEEIQDSSLLVNIDHFFLNVENLILFAFRNGKKKIYNKSGPRIQRFKKICQKELNSQYYNVIHDHQKRQKCFGDPNIELPTIPLDQLTADQLSSIGDTVNALMKIKTNATGKNTERSRKRTTRKSKVTTVELYEDSSSEEELITKRRKKNNKEVVEEEDSPVEELRPKKKKRNNDREAFDYLKGEFEALKQRMDTIEQKIEVVYQESGHDEEFGVDFSSVFDEDSLNTWQISGETRVNSPPPAKQVESEEAPTQENQTEQEKSGEVVPIQRSLLQELEQEVTSSSAQINPPPIQGLESGFNLAAFAQKALTPVNNLEPVNQDSSSGEEIIQTPQRYNPFIRKAPTPQQRQVARKGSKAPVRNIEPLEKKRKQLETPGKFKPNVTVHLGIKDPIERERVYGKEYARQVREFIKEQEKNKHFK